MHIWTIVTPANTVSSTETLINARVGKRHIDQDSRRKAPQFGYLTTSYLADQHDRDSRAISVCLPRYRVTRPEIVFTGANIEGQGRLLDRTRAQYIGPLVTVQEVGAAHLLSVLP